MRRLVPALALGLSLGALLAAGLPARLASLWVEPSEPVTLGRASRCAPVTGDPWLEAVGQALERFVRAARTVPCRESLAPVLEAEALRFTSGEAFDLLAAQISLRHPPGRLDAPAPRAVGEVAVELCSGPPRLWRLEWHEIGPYRAGDGRLSRHRAVFEVELLPLDPREILYHSEGMVITAFDWTVPGSPTAQASP